MLVLVEEVVVALVPAFADLLLEVSSQHQSAQQMELPTVSGDLAQPLAYVVHHCSHLPQLMVGYEVVDDLHAQL